MELKDRILPRGATRPPAPNPLHGVESWRRAPPETRGRLPWRIHYMELKVISPGSTPQLLISRIHYMELKGNVVRPVYMDGLRLESITWS